MLIFTTAVIKYQRYQVFVWYVVWFETIKLRQITSNLQTLDHMQRMGDHKSNFFKQFQQITRYKGEDKF